ncbi:MAG: tRNA preQ1(34) S-adenosylmethionine ribosyltransferase-isomerase QueA [Planctomycetota bacterium]
MKVSLFDYELPEHLVAAVPADRRDASRLMVLRRAEDRRLHRRFYELPEFLREGDLLVTNDARVLPARLRAARATGGAVEILLVRREGSEGAERERWLAMLRASGSLREGEELKLEEADRKVTLLQERGRGYWLLSLGGRGALPGVLQAGHTPLPPYIQRARRERGMPEEMPELDRERYQTVYAEHGGAVAAPTAGLHFTEELLQRLREAGVETRQLTLLVGPGTFRPVRSERVEEHDLEPEFYHLPDETAEAVRTARREDRRVVAVGTTTCRVLEYVARTGRWEAHEGWTDLFIHPPFEFRAVDALITNFHLPQSTLLMLVSALAGRERVLVAYREAVRRRYRFYSYGDAMLIL